MEFNTTVQWLSWVVDSLEVNNPALVGAVVASVPMNVSVVRVRVAMDIEASDTNISDVSSASVEPSHHLTMVVVSVWSNNGINIVLMVVVVTLSDRDDHSSVGSRSDSLGSPVEYPPLLIVVWVVVSDSESVLA